MNFISTSINIASVSANEFALTISLVVFVMLTAILLTLLIWLCASKSFRAVFFREKNEPRAKRKNPQRSESTANTAKTSKKQNDAASHPEYFEGIMTVPIGGNEFGSRPDSSEKTDKTDGDIFFDVPTVAIPTSRSSSVYTVNNIGDTIAKTGNGAKKPNLAAKKQSTVKKSQNRKSNSATKSGATDQKGKSKK